jgi:5'-deoxynucleotidase YfbR-like HD superfamily hydrolase
MKETIATENTDIAFLYARPKDIKGLSRGVNLAMTMGSTASRTVTELRTRTIHPDGRSENVSEHSHMLAKVAPVMAAELYPWLDTGLIALYSGLHDDPEMYVGDMPTDVLANHDPEAKSKLEALAVQQLLKEFTPVAPFYADLMERYEAQKEYEAQFTRIVDKFMVLLIHLPNQGATLRENYTYEQYLSAAHDVEKKLLEQYPEWIELIEMRTELAQYMCDTYMRDWVE